MRPEPIRLTLPYPPTANLYFRLVRGRMVKSAEARSYQRGVKLRALSVGCRPTDKPVAVIVAAYRPRRVGDLDNTLKIALDALNGVAWVDDSQVVELHASRHEDKARPRLEVTVSEVA